MSGAKELSGNGEQHEGTGISDSLKQDDAYVIAGWWSHIHVRRALEDIIFTYF